LRPATTAGIGAQKVVLVKPSANPGTGSLGMTDHQKTSAVASSVVEPLAETFLTEKQLAARHQRSPKTLRNDRVKGGYIPFVRIGHHVRYRLSDVLDYERAHRMDSTSSKQS
jgi:hypothetical protein